MKNIKDTIMSQYAHSPAILGLIEAMNDAIDPAYFIEDFYEYVYRLSTARGFALDIWASKVGVRRGAPIVNPEARAFGFRTGYEPFNTYPFVANGGHNSYQLPDSQLRELIIFKAALNITYATAININTVLRVLFKGKRAMYIITGHMKARYVFEFKLNALERMIVFSLDMLPMPSGVEISYAEYEDDKPFSFNGSELNNFNNGVFA